MRREVKAWFKNNDKASPWVKYSVVVLLSQINVTIGAGARDPSNKLALLSDLSAYSMSVIIKCRRFVEQWKTKLDSTIAGEEAPRSKIWLCTSTPSLLMFRVSTSHSHHSRTSHSGRQGGSGSHRGRWECCSGHPASPRRPATTCRPRGRPRGRPGGSPPRSSATSWPYHAAVRASGRRHPLPGEQAKNPSPRTH